MKNLPSLNPKKIKEVYIGNNELSPFHSFYANKKTVLRLAAGRYFAHYNGDDPVETYWALRKSAALYDVPERPVEITGPDALPFLENIFSRKISDMAIGRGRYVIACTFDGCLFMDGILFKLAENHFWFVHPDGELDAWLLANRDGFDITITDPHSRVLQLQGPNSYKIMHEVSNGQVDHEFLYFHSKFVTISGQKVYVSRTGWSGELGYEIYTLGEETDCLSLWNHLLKIGTPKGLMFSSMQSINTRRIEAGILDSGSDFNTSIDAFEVGLEKFVDLEKIGFIGRDALLSRPRGKRLFGVLCSDLIPSGGNLIFDGQIEVARVTTGAYSPKLDKGIGYALFHNSGNWVSKNLSIRSLDNGSKICKIVDLPFFDPKKRIPRQTISPP